METFGFYNWKLRKMIRRFGGAKIIIPIVIGLAILPTTYFIKRTQSLTTSATIEPVVFYMAPATQTLPPDSTFTLMADAKTNNVGFMHVTISFDPTKVHLSNEIQTQTFNTIVEKTAANDANLTGTASIVLALAPPDIANPPTGIFQIATLPFTPATTLSNQTASINISAVQVVDMNESILPTNTQPANLTLNQQIATPTANESATPFITTTITPTVSVTPSPVSFTISQISVLTISSSQATVVWNTSAPTTSQVKYGTSANALTNFTASDGTLTTSHSTTISALRRNTLYYYQVISGNSSGTVTSSIQSFRTKNK